MGKTRQSDADRGPFPTTWKRQWKKALFSRILPCSATPHAPVPRETPCPPAAGEAGQPPLRQTIPGPVWAANRAAASKAALLFPPQAALRRFPSQQVMRRVAARRFKTRYRAAPVVILGRVFITCSNQRTLMNTQHLAPQQLGKPVIFTAGDEHLPPGNAVEDEFLPAGV